MASLCLAHDKSEPRRLVGYFGSDYANCPDTNRSVGGHYFSLGPGAFSWSSSRQRTVANSSCYAKYSTWPLHNTAREATIVKQLLDGLLFCPLKSRRSNATATPRQYCRKTLYGTPELNIFRLNTRPSAWHRGERVRSSDKAAEIVTNPVGRVNFSRPHHGLD